MPRRAGVARGSLRRRRGPPRCRRPPARSPSPRREAGHARHLGDDRQRHACVRFAIRRARGPGQRGAETYHAVGAPTRREGTRCAVHGGGLSRVPGCCSRASPRSMQPFAVAVYELGHSGFIPAACRPLAQRFVGCWQSGGTAMPSALPSCRDLGQVAPMHAVACEALHTGVIEKRLPAGACLPITETPHDEACFIDVSGRDRRPFGACRRHQGCTAGCLRRLQSVRHQRARPIRCASAFRGTASSTTPISTRRNGARADRFEMAGLVPAVSVRREGFVPAGIELAQLPKQIRGHVNSFTSDLGGCA